MRLRVILRKLPSADILPEWKIDVLGRRSSNPAGSVEASTYTEKEKETNIGWVRERREREREGEGLFVGDENSSRSDVTGPLYIHALLIFTLLKDLSATRSAVIPAAPEYRGSIKRWRRNCVPKRIYRVTWKFLALMFRGYLSGWLDLDLRWKFERQMMQKIL